MYDKVAEKLKKYGQEHLLSFYPQLSAEEKQEFLEELNDIDLEEVTGLFVDMNKGVLSERDYSDLANLPNIDSTKLDAKEYKRLYDKGVEYIGTGKMAALTLAGGQGTRLGHEGPKGTYYIGLPSGKSIFEIQCCGLKYISDLCGCTVPWYIMTSRINHRETVEFFRENDFFGYPQESIQFFTQSVIPALSPSGKLMLEEKGKVFQSPNGNGGLFKSMKNKKIIDHMRSNGIENVFICGIDNCLVKMADPLFMGVMLDNPGIKAGAKSFMKRTFDEKAGILCWCNGAPGVIEYTEFPEEYAKMTNEDGSWKYGDANVLNYIFQLDIIDKLAESSMPYHIAVKKIPSVNVETGEKEIIEKGYKFELFLFDAFRYLEDMVVLRVDINREFAPVKNKTGIDSAESAREMLLKVKDARPDLVKYNVI